MLGFEFGYQLARTRTRADDEDASLAEFVKCGTRSRYSLVIPTSVASGATGVRSVRVSPRRTGTCSR